MYRVSAKRIYRFFW